MARTDKLPREAGLPHPSEGIGRLISRLNALWALLADQHNLLVDGFLLNVSALPTAEEKSRGRIVLLRGAAGVADTVHVCRKNAADAYEWKEVSFV